MSVEVFDEQDIFHPIGSVAVFCNQGRSSQLSFEFLSALYEDIDLHLVSCASPNDSFQCYLPRVGCSNTCPISLDSEVICPTLKLFDSSIFAFNYQNF